MHLLTNESTSKNKTHIIQSLTTFCKDIKVSHSIFALPFAFSVFFIETIPLPSSSQIGWLLVCMVFARSFAMGTNRFLDWKFDRLNPRTTKRMIPSGRMTPNESLSWSLFAGVIFVIAASQLGTLALQCSLPLLVFLGTYSILKRFTWLTHFYLGVCLGLSPIAVQIAIHQDLSLKTVLLGLGIALWTSGFDILYSIQDLSFDQKLGLRSFPSAFGPKKSYIMTGLCFLAALIVWACLGPLGELGLLYSLGVALIGLILALELWLVRDLWHTGYSTQLNQAFFAVNGWVSVVFLVFTVAGRYLDT